MYPHGLGSRRLVDDPRWGAAEALELIPELSTIAAERAIRTRATSQRESGIARDDGPVAAVHEVRRVGDTLVVVSSVHDGVRLSDLLGALEKGTLTLTDVAILDLATAVVRAMQWLHDRPGSHVHGALSPDQVVLRRDGAIVLTDTVFAEALQYAQWNRDRCWREWGLALPASASAPRFDQRSDVVELGAVVLAVLLRRPLAAGEYPAAIPDLIATAAATSGVSALALRGWLQQALHLHPRMTFASAVEAAAGFAAAVAGPVASRPPAKSRGVIRNLITSLASSW
jgi:hypothetical protein